jgi:branched-chain amino acid transport system substrate-binding protein
MKTTHSAGLLRRVWAVPLILLLAALAVIALTVACGGDDEEGPTPGTTPGATETAPTTPAATVTPGEVGPGITDTEIIIGADHILSGASAAVYSMIPKATNAYFEYVNDTQGGVCGRKIVYKIEDSQDSPDKGVEAVRKLVERDNVFAIVGSLGDTPHPAVWEFLNENEVPDILCSAASHIFGADPEGHPWTIQMIPSYRIEATFFGEYVSENLPGKKVGILYSNSIGGKDALEGAKQGLDPDKNEVVSEQVYEVQPISLRSQVINMKNDGVEVVITNAGPTESSQAMKEAKRLGWDPDWLISYINSDQMMFQFVSPEDMEGVISFQAFKLAGWTDDPAVAQHYEIMGKYDGPPVTNFSLYAQLLGEVAVEALSRTCDNLTREGLMDAVESIQDYQSDLLLEGVNISFSDTDHTALQTGRMLRAVLEDGKGKFEYFGPLYEFELE